MRLLAPLQFLVIRSNAYWPFSWLNKLPYFLTIKLFTRLCSGKAQIHSAYLRHSVAEGRWEPGLSDVDLTIVLIPGLTREEEFEFLAKFRRSYQNLAKFVPILGELEVLPLNYLQSWIRYSFRGRGVDRWILLCGQDFRQENTFQIVPVTGFDRLSYALYCYLDTFMNRVLQPLWGPLLEPEFLRRLLMKIQHFTGNLPQDGQNPASIPSREMIHLQIVQAMENASANQGVRLTSTAFEGNPARPPAEALPVLEQEVVTRSLVSLLEGTRHYFAILDLDAPPATLLQSLAHLRDQLGHASRKLVIFGPNSFAFHVGQNDPFLYAELSENRVIHVGVDLLPGVTPPSAEAIFLKIVSQFSMSLATFPQGPEMFRLQDHRVAADPVYLSILNRIMYVKILLETGELPKSGLELHKASLARYAQVFEQFQRLVKLQPSDRALFLFKLFRDQLDSVNQMMGELKNLEDLTGCGRAT